MFVFHCNQIKCIVVVLLGVVCNVAATQYIDGMNF